MTPDRLFLVCSFGVVPAWLLLIFAPHWVWTTRLVHRVWLPGLLSVVYLWILIARPPLPSGASLTSLSGAMTLFGSPFGALAVWLHSLAFDLFVGSWQVRDAQRNNMRHRWVVLPLVGTFAYGPVGLLLYFMIRCLTTRSTSLQEA